MTEVTFLTGNAGKMALAQSVIPAYGITLRQAGIDLPEIQSLDVTEVARHAISAGYETMQCPVFKSDAGYYVEALNGFPGALVKFINQSLTADQLISLMHGQKNRRVWIRECLSYKASPNHPVQLFTHQYEADFLSEVCRTPSATPINQVIAITALGKPIAACSSEELVAFWAREVSAYHELAQYIIASTA